MEVSGLVADTNQDANEGLQGEAGYSTEEVAQTVLDECPEQILKPLELDQANDQSFPTDENISISKPLRAVSPTPDLPEMESRPNDLVETRNLSVAEDKRRNDSPNLIEIESKHLEILSDESQNEISKCDLPRPVASISEGGEDEQGRNSAGSEEQLLILTSPPSPSLSSSSSSHLQVVRCRSQVVVGGADISSNEVTHDTFDTVKPEVDSNVLRHKEMSEFSESNPFGSKSLEISNSDASINDPRHVGVVSSLTELSSPSDSIIHPTREDDSRDHCSSETVPISGLQKPNKTGVCSFPLPEVSGDSDKDKPCDESVAEQCPRSLNSGSDCKSSLMHKSHFETTGENAGETRKSHGMPSPEPINAPNCNVTVAALSSIPSSTSSLPLSSSHLSSYDGSHPSPLHNFYDSYKSQSKSSEIQPLQQSYSYSEDHWTNAATLGGVAQNETIKRKQKSLNDIIIRMLNDSSNKVHRAVVEASCDVRPPPFVESDSSTKKFDRDEIVINRPINADIEEEDDEDNDNLEIQIDDDVDVEAADKHDGKPRDESPGDVRCADIANGGTTDFQNRDMGENFRQTPNCSLDDFQKLSSFVQDSDRRGCQEIPDYQAVKPDEDASRVDILESGYLFPYDSRFYNVHLFEKFLPHTYHGEYKTSSLYHESSHIGGRAICNSGTKDRYSIDFGSDAIDLTKNTRPNATASGNSFPSKIHDAKEDGRRPTIEAPEIEGCEKKLNRDHRYAAGEAVSYLDADDVVVDGGFVSSDMSRGHPGSVTLLEAEGHDLDELGRPGNIGRDSCSISKMKEEDHLSKDGIKGMKAYQENPCPPKECESKAFSLPPYRSGTDVDKLSTSHADPDDYCQTYQYQNSGNKSAKYSLMAEMGNSFYAYYANAHYNGSMGLYGSMGRCLSVSDKMQPSESQESSSLETQVLNLAKQDKVTSSYCDGSPLNSGHKGEIDHDTESSCCSPNKPGQTEMAHLFLDTNVNALEITTAEGKARSSRGSLSPKNMENQTIELARSNSSNPSQTNSGGALIDQTTYDSRLPQNLQVSSEHHKEMAKTKSMWRDKYLAEDSGLHFTNFSSISRLEQCVSSIDYDKPLADKKDRLKLSADMEKELRSFRMGLKMLGDSGTKSFDGREDLSLDRNRNEASSGRGSSRKSNQKSLGAGESKRNRRSKSSKVSDCKKSCPSEIPQDFSIVNDYQMNGHLSHVPCLDYSRDRPIPPRSCNPAEMHGSLPDVNDLSSPETGKKKRGRKKKEMDSSMQNIENHFKSSESSNFSEYVHGYGMPSNNFSGYPDGFYNSNVNFRQQHLQHQMCVTNKYSRTLPQTEKLSSPSILKVPDSHLSSSISSAKKKHAGASNCLKSDVKDKNKRSAELLGHIERSTDGGDVNDDESFLCNGASLDVYLNEPKEYQKSNSWMEDEKQDEETDRKLPFSFDADQKTFTCHHCSYQVKRKGQLMKHLGGHQIFVCTHCNAKCPDRQKLEEHLLDVHPTRCGRRLCKRCHVLFRLEELERHEIECNGEKQGWACDLCDKKFRFLSAVKNHVGKWHKNETSKFDSRCDDSVKKTKLKSSSEAGRSGKGVEYVDESTILDEIQIVDLPQLETMSVEMNFFAEASSPNRDSSTDACSRRSSTPNREKQSTRSDKNKTSARSKNERKVRTFQCEMCPKFYRSMQSLKIHRQKKHADFDEKRTESEGTVPSAPATREASSSEETCNMDAGAGASEGGRDDPSNESVRGDAEGEIAFAKECGEQSSDKPNRRARDDNAESSIDKTNDDFPDDDASGGLPSSHFPLSDGWFQCTYESCSKRFRKLEQVQKHEERHPIDKIYKCDWPGCRKAYIHYANLYSHRSHHITAKPFICNLCSSAYWQKCSLNSHKARVHGIKNLPGVPGPDANGRRVDGPCLDACDDDSKTITSNVSVSETGGFPDGEKSDNGTASSSGLTQMNNKEAAREDEGVYDRNRCQNQRDDNNNHIALLKDVGKKRMKSISKEDTKSKLKDEPSEMNKSESSPNSSNNERAEKHGKEVCILHEKSSKAIETKSPKMDTDKSEVSRASANDQDVASGKKKRGRKPKNAKPLEEKETANKEKGESAISSTEKPQNVSEFTSGYKITESRCVVEELLLSTKFPSNRRDPEEMTPLEVALADLGAREIESCDDASFGTEKTKTKRKIRTSLNYRKKSKLAKKFNQEASGRSETSAQPSATSSTVSVCTDKIVVQKEQPILEDHKDESKAEVTVDKSVREEVRSMDDNLKQITETVQNRINKIPEVPRLNLVVESQNTETTMSSMTGEKAVIGNVYEFCESEGEECIGSNKSAEKKSVKKNLLTKKSEIKDSGLQNERRGAEDSDDDASLDFKLSRSKPLKTYLDRPKKKIPSSSYSVDSSSSASLTGGESPLCCKSKQKRKLKSKSPDINQPLSKKLRGDLPTTQNGFSFDVDDRERCSINDQQVQASKEVSEEKMMGKGTTLPRPMPAKKASKRRKNEVEVLLEDTLSRPATADKKSSSGRVSKRSELFNFERSISSKLEIRNSPETKNAEIKTPGQKKTPKDKDGASASESAENNGIGKSEPESSKAMPSPSKDSDSGSSEINSEIRSQPIESRLAKKRKAESLVPMFYDDTLQLKGDCTTPKKDLGSEHVVKETVGEIPIENCDSNVCSADGVKDKTDASHDDVKEVLSSNIQIQEENSMREELMSVAESPPCSNPNIVLKLRIREVDQTTSACEMARENNQVTEQESNSQDQSRVQSLSDTFNSTDAMVSAQTVAESSKPDDAAKAPSRSMTEDNDSQSSLIDSLEYLRIGEVEKPALLSERSSDMPRLGDEGGLVLDPRRQSSVVSPDAASHLEKQPDNADDYCMEDTDDNGGFVKPSEPPSTWRNYDYEDTGYEPQSERRRSKDKVENALRLENGQEEAQIETIKANSSSRENSEPEKLSHFGKAGSPEKDGFCNVPSHSADRDSEVTGSKESHVDAKSDGFLKSSSIPDPVPLRIGLEEISDKLYHAKNQGFEHPDVAYSADQFRNGMAESRPISPFNHSKELSHPVSSLHRKDSKLSIDALAEGQPYSTACSSSYFDYQVTAGKKSDPHPLSSLESLATLAPSAGLGGYFDSVVPPEKRLSNDLNKPPRSNNFHPEIPPPPPPHTPFPANPYRNFSGYEADLALLGANRHKGYRYNERPFDPSLSVPYGYDRPDLHHPSYHVGTNFTPPDSRFFSQFLQSTDAVDQRYYGGQQSGFGDFHKAAASGIAGDPKNKFASTSFTSLLAGSPYSGLSDSYLSSLTPNISNAPSLTANQLGNYSRGEGWNGERPWTAVPPSTNDPSIQYQQQQSHSSSRKQQQQQHPPNDYDSSKKTPSSSSASVRGSSDTHFYNSYDTASPRLRNLATPGPPPVAPTGHKRLEEAYRQAAAIMSSDYNQHHPHPSLIQPTPNPAADVYGPVDPMMNPAAFPGFNRYYYSAARDAVYRSQQRLAAMHHHQQQQQQPHPHNPSLSPFSNAVNLAGFPSPGYPPDPFAPLPASTAGMPYSSKNQHYPGSRGVHGNGGGSGKHHQNQIPPLASTGAPPPQTSSKNSKSSKAILPPLGLGGMAPSFDHLNSSNFLHQQNPSIPPDPYRQSVIYNMIPKYF